MLSVPEHVRKALQSGHPVVALESTVIAHGLPYPHNLELALAVEEEVRAAGAVPATIGVVGGAPTIGLSPTTIEQFARGADTSADVARPLKLSRRDLAPVIAARRDGATTVSATMALAAMAGITVFATGGIGGVHRGARESWDISADLSELARTTMLVVCAGAKAILDLPATLEYLETVGVPVIGWGTDTFPAFYSREADLPLTARVETATETAIIWHLHQELGGRGMLLAVPPPAEVALPYPVVEVAIEQALTRAAAAGVRGQAVTPFLLTAVAEETHGESLHTNMALLRQNARVAAQIAVEISRSI